MHQSMHDLTHTHAENKQPKRMVYVPSGDLAELELRAKRQLTEGSTSVVIINLPSEERTQSKKSMPSKQKNQEAWLTIDSAG